MRYLMFAKTVGGDEYRKVVSATTDDEAMECMCVWVRRYHGEPWSVAGVWERDPQFYTADKMSDLAE